MKIFILIISFIAVSAYAQESVDYRNMSLSDRFKMNKKYREDQKKEKIRSSDSMMGDIFNKIQTNGVNGLSALDEKIPGKATREYVDGEMEKTDSISSEINKIKKILESKDGVLESFEKTSEEEIIGGNIKKITYFLKYKNGMTQNISMQLVKTTIDGEYYISEIDVGNGR